MKFERDDYLSEMDAEQKEISNERERREMNDRNRDSVDIDLNRHNIAQEEAHQRWKRAKERHRDDVFAEMVDGIHDNAIADALELSDLGAIVRHALLHWAQDSEAVLSRRYSNPKSCAHRDAWAGLLAWVDLEAEDRADRECES